MMGGDPVGAALLLAAPFGLAGIFLLALAERLVPLLPSSGLFVAIGVAAAEGFWCLWVAVAASVLGSGTGAFSAYRAGTAMGLGSDRVRRTLRRRDRIGGALRTARRGAAAFPLTAQLIPATRILAPLVGGTVPHDRRRFILRMIAGLTLWNAAFIGLGFAVTRFGGPSNATVVSLVAMSVAAGVTLLIRLTLRGRGTVGVRPVRSRAPRVATSA